LVKKSGPEIDFASLFHPKSIAIFGASSDEVLKINIANRFISVLLEFGYAGKIYPVGPKAGKVSGLPIFADVKDVPGDVDFAIAVVPNRQVPAMVRDCGEKGVKIIHLFASGFDEIEDKIGTELQQEILKIAQKYNIRFIGPNCMGVYCPASHMTYATGYSPIEGRVGYLSQSGGHSIMGIKEANRRGIYFSKVVSYGNAADINECDLLEYFSGDPETDIITVYVEGTDHGPRLLKTLGEATRLKPVVLFKGADTEGGRQAAISHTSSIAGSSRTWDALVRQTGAIRVYNVQEMFDVVSVLQRCSVPESLNTLIIGQGGGTCVQATDDCYREGLKMPGLPFALRQVLKDIYKSEAGNIFTNPLDVNPYWGLDRAKAAFSAVSDWEAVDVNLLLATPEQTPFMLREWEYQVTTDTAIEWAKLSQKTTLMVLNVQTMPGEDGLAEKAFNKMTSAGFAVFPSAKRAALAVSRVYAYYQWRKQHCT
jgi:acetate---CoA ligase (ADP-forming)